MGARFDIRRPRDAYMPPADRQTRGGRSAMEDMMKRVILAALAVLSLGAGSAVAQSLSHGAAPSHHQSSVNGN
jgi:hypothetical protein